MESEMMPVTLEMRIAQHERMNSGVAATKRLFLVFGGVALVLVVYSYYNLISRKPEPEQADALSVTVEGTSV